MGPHEARVRALTTSELSPALVVAVRRLLFAAFEPDPEERFTEDDWQHALGGTHFVAEIGGEVVGHAAVVRRALQVSGRPVDTGYVEAVATTPSHQGRGIGTRVMRKVGEHIVERFEMGALGTGSHRFYERLGWVTWRGPSAVRTAGGERATPGEDGCIMVLRTPATARLDLEAPISCEWRPGDVW